jgi:hypothetical protein
MLDFLNACAKRTFNNGVFLKVIGPNICLAAFENGVFQFAQFYTTKSNEEKLYYTMLAYQKASLSPDAIPLVLSGNIDEHDSFYKFLYSYIRTIVFDASRLNIDYLQTVFSI